MQNRSRDKNKPSNTIEMSYLEEKNDVKRIIFFIGEVRKKGIGRKISITIDKVHFLKRTFVIDLIKTSAIHIQIKKKNCLIHGEISIGLLTNHNSDK